MTVGIDVFHHTHKASVVGFVASYNAPVKQKIKDEKNDTTEPAIGCTRWFSRSIEQPQGQEYVDMLTLCISGN
jgi:hypothetical protein